MVGQDDDFPGYVADKIRQSIDSEKEVFPNKQDFCLALHEIYFSDKPLKLAEILEALAHYHYKKEHHVDYLKAFEKSMTELASFSKRADKFYNFRNGEIQEFYENSRRNICRHIN